MPTVRRTKNFEASGSYANTWNKNEDGQVNTNGPRVTVGDHMGPQSGMITRSVTAGLCRHRCPPSPHRGPP